MELVSLVDMWAVQHWRAGKRLLRYLKGTTELGIFYKRKSKESLEVYTDSDYAGDMDDRRSTSGSAFLLGSAASPFLWSWKKQPISHVSTTDDQNMVLQASCAMVNAFVKTNFGRALVTKKRTLLQKNSFPTFCNLLITSLGIPWFTTWKIPQSLLAFDIKSAKDSLSVWLKSITGTSNFTPWRVVVAGCSFSSLMNSLGIVPFRFESVAIS
ncbi:hypothetical protein Tco_0367842 [Tanacetum coccineum]